MKNIPVNRWVIGGILVLTAVFGGDFVTAVFRVLQAVGYSYMPAG
jgi:N-acetylglutamate synthase/N-acetylornithine aminotransferase